MILYKKIIIKNLHKPVKKFNIIAVMFKTSVFLKKERKCVRGLFLPSMKLKKREEKI